MTITPRDLLVTSVGQLRTLAAFLGDQLGEIDGHWSAAAGEARACHDALASLRVLIARLEVALAHTVTDGDAREPRSESITRAPVARLVARGSRRR